MARFHGAAFDMDGLMFETESVYCKAADELLGRRGYPYTEALYQDVMGRPPRYCFEQFIKTYSLPETWEELAAESEEIFLDVLKEGYSTMPGLFGLLDALESEKIAKCVATSSSRRLASAVLSKDDIGERFDFILTSDDITRGKPDPQIYLLAAERLGIKPSELLVLEDSAAGVLAAKRSGAVCFALRAEHNKDLDLSPADFIGTSLDAPEILAAVHGVRG